MSHEQRLISFYNRQIMLTPIGSEARQRWIDLKREVERRLQSRNPQSA